MRSYLTSTVYALVLARFFVSLALASPIPFPELAPGESSNTDSDLYDNLSSISPLVVRSERDQGKMTQPSDLWSGITYVPAAFWPRSAAVSNLSLKIPNKKYPQGLNSIINIAGLMRTAVERNKLAEGRSTSLRLAVWMRKMKKAKVVGAMVFAEPLISPSIKTLEGDALMERKEMIRDAVMAHNEGEWYTPTGEIEDQIRDVHRNWKTVKIENKKIIKAASHNTAPTQQHQYQSSSAPNSDPMVSGSSTTMPQSYTTQLEEHPVTNMGSQHSQFTGITTVHGADGGHFMGTEVAHGFVPEAHPNDDTLVGSINHGPAPGFHDHFSSTYSSHLSNGITNGLAKGLHEHVPMSDPPHRTGVIPFYDGNHFMGDRAQVTPKFFPEGLPNNVGTIHAPAPELNGCFQYLPTSSSHYPPATSQQGQGQGVHKCSPSGREGGAERER